MYCFQNLRLRDPDLQQNKGTVINCAACKVQINKGRTNKTEHAVHSYAAGEG